MKDCKIARGRNGGQCDWKRRFIGIYEDCDVVGYGGFEDRYIQRIVKRLQKGKIVKQEELYEQDIGGGGGLGVWTK